MDLRKFKISNVRKVVAVKILLHPVKPEEFPKLIGKIVYRTSGMVSIVDVQVEIVFKYEPGTEVMRMSKSHPTGFYKPVAYWPDAEIEEDRYLPIDENAYPLCRDLVARSVVGGNYLYVVEGDKVYKAEKLEATLLNGKIFL